VLTSRRVQAHFDGLVDPEPPAVSAAVVLSWQLRPFFSCHATVTESLAIILAFSMDLLGVPMCFPAVDGACFSRRSGLPFRSPLTSVRRWDSSRFSSIQTRECSCCAQKSEGCLGSRVYLTKLAPLSTSGEFYCLQVFNHYRPM
jgi:hypothetical protein